MMITAVDHLEERAPSSSQRSLGQRLMLLFLRLIAPLVWRSDEKIARKLEGFAATEAGSALDMLKAAELAEDPLLRRLFFRHAMDEARHATLFRAQARALCPDAALRGSSWNRIHATRQNLFENLGLVRFIAFVWLAERRGELQFRALRSHFADRPALTELFTRIGRDEKFHVSYSARILDDWRAAGHGAAVRRALWSVRATRAWEAWRRSGRLLGELVTRAVMTVVYFAALPAFALVAARETGPRTGWHTRKLAAPAESAPRQW